MALLALGIALQGLDAPLSAIMAAVQGLLAGNEPPEPPYIFGGVNIIASAPRTRRRRGVRMGLLPRQAIDALTKPIDTAAEQEREDEDLLLLGVL